MALNWLNQPWAKDVKSACEILDNIDLTNFFLNYYIDLTNLIEDIINKYPETETTVFDYLGDEDFLEYLLDRYKDTIQYNEEVRVTHWIRQRDYKES